VVGAFTVDSCRSMIRIVQDFMYLMHSSCPCDKSLLESTIAYIVMKYSGIHPSFLGTPFGISWWGKYRPLVVLNKKFI